MLFSDDRVVFNAESKVVMENCGTPEVFQRLQRRIFTLALTYMGFSA